MWERDDPSLIAAARSKAMSRADADPSRLSGNRFTRTRLTSRIAEAVACGQNVVLNAPAGFGKRSIAAEFVFESDLPFAWIDLRSLSSASAFWDEVSLSFGVDFTSAGFGPLAQRDGLPWELGVLINFLLQQDKAHVLVLESCDCASSFEKSRIVQAFCNRRFANLSVFFIYGGGSSWKKLGPIVQGEACYLGVRDFVLSSDEFDRMVDALGLDGMSPAALEFAREQVDGWPVGLKLLSISNERQIRHFSALQGFDAFPSWRFEIRRYLEQEILPEFSEAEQEFLLLTSILPAVTPKACAVLSNWGLVEVQGFLNELRERGFLLVPGNGCGGEGLELPRYQRLFAVGLRLVLEERRAGGINDMIRMAAECYEEDGDFLAASCLASNFGRLDLFVKVIDDHYEEIVTSGWVQGFADAISRFSPSDVSRHPRLPLVKAWACLSQGYYGEAEHLMDVVEASILGNDQGAVEGIRDDLFSARLMLEILNYDANGITRLVMMHNLNHPDGCSLDHSFLQGLVNLSLGLSGAIAGNLSEAKDSLLVAYGTSYSSLVKYLAVFFLSEIALRKGELAEAVRCLNDALDIAQDANAAKAPFSSLAYIRLAGTYYEQNLLDDARRCLKRGMSLGKNWWVPDVMCSGYSTIGHIESATGSPVDLSLSYKSEEKERTGRFRRIHKPFFMHYSYQKLKASVDAGNQDESIRKAKALFSLYQQGLVQSDVSSLHEFLWVGSMMYAIGCLKETVEICNDLVPIAEENEYITELLDILILRAIAQQARRNNGEATADIVKAIDYAEPRGYFRAFVDEGSVIVPLLRRAKVVSSRPGYVQRIVDAIKDQEPVFSEDGQSCAQVLGRREVQVLKLAYTGLVNKEIASLLGLSSETVKSYFKSISTKLGVNNKMEAIRKASDMGLLDDGD